jgi:predicted nucleotide-binding protein (sugar kinase/HSP70/actin superfamily)
MARVGPHSHENKQTDYTQNLSLLDYLSCPKSQTTNRCICVCRYVHIVANLPFYYDVFTSSDCIMSNVGRMSEKQLEGMWKEVVVDDRDVSSR